MRTYVSSQQNWLLTEEFNLNIRKKNQKNNKGKYSIQIQHSFGGFEKQELKNGKLCSLRRHIGIRLKHGSRFTTEALCLRKP